MQNYAASRDDVTEAVVRAKHKKERELTLTL